MQQVLIICHCIKISGAFVVEERDVNIQKGNRCEAMTVCNLYDRVEAIEVTSESV